MTISFFSPFKVFYKFNQENIKICDFEEMMKRGYIEMAEINLEYSMIGSEYMLDDVNEYEAWICGV